jgi:hypothetical protein
MALMPPQVEPTQPPKKLPSNNSSGTKDRPVRWIADSAQSIVGNHRGGLEKAAMKGFPQLEICR